MSTYIFRHARARDSFTPTPTQRRVGKGEGGAGARCLDGEFVARAVVIFSSYFLFLFFFDWGI